MAAYLNRTVSMVTGKSSSGNNSNNTSPTSSGAPSSSNMELANALTDTTTIQRGLHHSGIDSSPLQIFVRAKKKINDIFSEIEDYVVETTRFIDGESRVFTEWQLVLIEFTFSFSSSSSRLAL